ncbi:hypothetical protein FACS189430_01170 [Bacteroidia bacterium]|nr:hypothetical protein FACS189430_01170 [Bacteroidia bacterium]
MDEQNNRKALSAMEKGELEEAERYMCKTTERIPYLINRSTVNKILYDKTKDASYLKNATMYLEKATLKNSHDSMIRYYLALVLREQGNSDSALHIVQELADRFPNKSLYRLSVFSMLYENGQQEASFSHLLQAVKLSPDYLDSPYLKEILLKNTALNESLRHRLLQDISADISGNNPILLAKEGKIYLSLSRENEARQCFEKAILLLPNLIYPHYYLCKLEAIILEQKMIYLKQFVFLNSGNISKDAIDQMITSGSIEKIVRNKSYFQDPSYSAKFQTWYHSAILHSSSF